MTTHMNLLIDEEPLQVLPSLACAVGLHEAIVLQQIHYWLNPKRKSGKVVDGTRWIFNSYGQWQEQFPFLTEKVIGNAIRSLEKQGYLLSRQDLNAVGSDRRKWYTIDYDRFWDVERPDSDDGRPYRDDDDTQMGRSSITETTAETTTETTNTIDQEFENWYATYPRKEGRKKALEAWMKACQKTRNVQPLFDALVAQINNNWKGKDKQFIPLPASWLNGERWEDEIVPPKTNGNGQRPAPRYYEKDGSYTAEGALARMRGEIE
jgi:hypothetical protein